MSNMITTSIYALENINKMGIFASTLRIVQYESNDHCHQFKFDLSQNEWERVKDGFKAVPGILVSTEGNNMLKITASKLDRI